MIAVVCPTCGGDTLWRYPNHQWARERVPDLPPRCYSVIHARDERRQPMTMAGRRACPEPFAHLESHRAIRDAAAAAQQSFEDMQDRIDHAVGQYEDLGTALTAALEAQEDKEIT